jgi:hypothetical protein
MDHGEAIARQCNALRARVAEAEADALKAINRQIALVKERDALSAQVAALIAALHSIARNRCCDRCQEAALVAQAALRTQ